MTCIDTDIFIRLLSNLKLSGVSIELHHNSIIIGFLKILLSGTSSDCIMGRLSVLRDSTFISIKALVMKLFKHMGYP